MALVLACVCLGTATSARAGEDVSDAELATKAVVVVARLVPGPLEMRTRKDGDAVVDTEQRVALEIERVLAGSESPGRTTVLLQDGLHVQEGGGPVWANDLAEAGESSPPGMAFQSGIDVSASHLWLLERGRSVDPMDKGSYLVLRRTRGVQRLELEHWFAALRAPDAARRVPALLGHASPYVVAAALAHVAGGPMPWPETSEVLSAVGPERTSEPPLKGEAARVRKLLASKTDSLRMHAAGVLHHLEGPASAPSLRRLLTDPSADVVATAMGLLLEQRDASSLDALATAATALARKPVREDLPLAALARLADWEDPRLIPVLIGLLDGPEIPGDTAGLWSPASYAQALLYQRAGYGFPLRRVAACQAAWKEALARPNEAERATLLTQRLGADHAPLSAELVPEPSHADGYLLEIRNRGSQPLTVMRRPRSDFRDQGMNMGVMLAEKKGRDAFVELKPGESIREHINLRTRGLRGVRWETSIFLRYTDDGSAVGLRAWTGGVWVTHPPIQDLVRGPSEAQRAELEAALKGLLAAAKARDDASAIERLAMVDIQGYDDWEAPLGMHDRRQEIRAKKLLGRLRLALEHGEPEILRIQVRGGQDGKRTGPFLDAKVRFGAGPEAQTLSLRFRRALGRLLLGIVERY